MGIREWLGWGGGDESKTVDLSPQLWSALLGGFGLPTKSGTEVSTSSALQVPAFYRGILVIADGVAQLPVEIYRRLSGGRGSEPAIDRCISSESSRGRPVCPAPPDSRSVTAR